MSHVFRTPVSLPWSDLDAINHVNNATYLRYLEETRIQWLNAQEAAWFDDERAPVLASARSGPTNRTKVNASPRVTGAARTRPITSWAT